MAAGLPLAFLPPRLDQRVLAAARLLLPLWLRRCGIEAVQVEELQRLAQAMRDVQLGRSRLFNTSGQSYRALGAATVRSWDDATALAALAADGKLIKRPLLITDQGVILTGFQPQEWERLLLAPEA